LQAGLAWEPTSAHVEWTFRPSCHDESTAWWQLSHAVENPAAWWLGLVDCWYAALWHPTHSLVVPA
jgi:hypothetical protein